MSFPPMYSLFGWLWLYMWRRDRRAVSTLGLSVVFPMQRWGHLTACCIPSLFCRSFRFGGCSVRFGHDDHGDEKDQELHDAALVPRLPNGR